jgi:hypothetical protein
MTLISSSIAILIEKLNNCKLHKLERNEEMDGVEFLEIKDFINHYGFFLVRPLALPLVGITTPYL